MRVTLIPEDQVVVIDGIAKFGIDMSSLDPSYHAVQWYDTYGEIEIYEGHRCVENRPITSLDEFQFAIDAWNAIPLPISS